jgi:hypothetical protein
LKFSILFLNSILAITYDEDAGEAKPARRPASHALHHKSERQNDGADSGAG